MDPSAAGFTPAKGIDAGMVASPLESVKEGRPPKLKPKPEPPKNLSAMNLKMSEKDEEVAASVDTVLSETATKEEKHTCASKVGHAVKEGTWLAVATLGLDVDGPLLHDIHCGMCTVHTICILSHQLTPGRCAMPRFAS
jgi:hypothetical protein